MLFTLTDLDHPTPFQELFESSIRKASLRYAREQNDLLREHVVYYMGEGAPTNDHDLLAAALAQGFYFEEYSMIDGTRSLCITRDGIPLVVELVAESREPMSPNTQTIWREGRWARP